MAQLRHKYDEIRSAGAEVVMVSFVRPQSLSQYVRDLSLPFVVLWDDDRRVYRAYGLRSAPLLQVYSARVLWGYVKMMLTGHRLRKPVGDVRQLGGDFVIDGEGIVRLAHPSQRADDRPGVDELVSLVRNLT